MRPSTMLLAALLALGPRAALAQQPRPTPSPSPSPSPLEEVTTPELPTTTFAQPIGQPAGPMGAAPRREPEVAMRRAPQAQYYVRLRETWEDNPLFLDTTQDATSFVDNAVLGGSVSVRRPRSLFALSSEGSGVRYHDLKELNKFNYSGAAALTYRVSTRATFTAREAYRVNYSRFVEELARSGLLLPLARSNTNLASADVAVALSNRTSFGIGARHELVNFDRNDLVDGSTLSLSGIVDRRVGADQLVRAGYTLQRNDVSNTIYKQHLGFVGWSLNFARRATLSLAGGAARTTAAGLDQARWLPYGSAGLAARLRRGTLTAEYTRSVSQAFGFGRQRVADLVSASATRSLGRVWDLSATYTHGASQEVSGSAFQFDTDSAGAGLRWRPHQRFEVEGTYSWSRSTSQARGPVTGQSVGLSFSYSRSR